MPHKVRVAMAPSVRETADSRHVSPGIRPSPRKDTNAKLEKRTVPASGKVKLRDLVSMLGGIVFWDAGTHTATVYAGHLMIEFTIGSDVAKVNGKAMHLGVAPRIVGGRTIIDAKAYHEAVAYVEKHGATFNASAH